MCNKMSHMLVKSWPRGSKLIAATVAWEGNKSATNGKEVGNVMYFRGFCGTAAWSRNLPVENLFFSIAGSNVTIATAKMNSPCFLEYRNLHFWTHRDWVGCSVVKSHRLIELGWDLCRPSGPTPCLVGATKSWVRRTMSRWFLNIDSRASLGNLCQCLVTLSVKKGFLLFLGNWVSVCAHCLWPCHWAYPERVWLPPLCALPSGTRTP